MNSIVGRLMMDCKGLVIEVESRMGRVKEDAIALIQALPDDCSLEDIQYHLYVRSKVERGLQDVQQGRVLTQEETEKRVEEWLKSSGPKHP